MEDVIRGMTGPQFIGFAAVLLGLGGGIAAALAAILGTYWQAVRQCEAESLLKRDLAGAGFSADEIERVVQATGRGTVASRR